MVQQLEMTKDLYGAKCFRCAHLLGPTHATGFIWPSESDDCQDCAFCQEDAFLGAFMRAASCDVDTFSPVVRQAVRAVFEGKPHPLIDQLKADIRETGQG
jgi:hypothetical protein